MADNLDSIKEKLKKLIAKEASAREIGNIHEAEAFAQHIQKLLMEYELEMDEVKGHNKAEQMGDEMYDTSALTLRNESDWVALLYIACGPSAFCRAMLLPSKYSKNSTFGEMIAIFGAETNRELLHYMVAQLVVKCRNAARISFSKYDGDSKRNTYIRSFLKGCAAGIHEKLREQREHAKTNQPGVYGLVINRDASMMVYLKKWLSDHRFKMGKSGKNTMGSSPDGYAEGFVTGKETEINKGVKGTAFEKPKQLT